ncbi:osmotically inducible protein Y [Legionella londiniensis]|uniref:Osmotically inducible protein Y n=2 Tax=Legionella londiniensis TaxID=45068 RepID=A0A0W0VTD1_9GAMM|nr:BON domain-containing protein [Legionella londiniensis]KTD23327.1 osmotically inducible protein Y [Legionella londiniensis]STX94118.1 osmotically inducible protein Y [Legionella londiniensis]
MRLLYSIIFLPLLLIANIPTHAADLKHLEQQFSDSFITAKITAKFTESKNLNPLKISVSTDKGVVHLHGHVKNKEAFVEALRLAVSTKGVKCVDTEDLHIKRVNTLFTDAYITAKVEAAVLKAKVLDDESIPLVGINATTTNGIVTLSGRVKNKQSIAFIIKRVSAVRGVKKVIAHLDVKSDIL